MAPETSAARRAYEKIKQQILDGTLPVRGRIDVEALARSLGLSSMPVRQALGQLTWERLVRPGRQSGYEVTLWSEVELAQLYEWRGALLVLALPVNAAVSELKRTARTQPYAQAVFNVMRMIDEQGNLELRRAATNADERLTAARMIETDVLGDVDAEFATLVAALAESGKRPAGLVKAYHRRRVQHARAIRERVVLSALPRNGDQR